jgi:hypothetical protein
MSGTEAAALGSHVVSGHERRIAVSHWLLTAAPDIRRAQDEWLAHGVALLRCGGIFAAVRLAGELVRAAARCAGQEDVDAFLRQAVDGPVFRHCRGDRYYALVPSSTRWPSHRYPGTDLLGRDTYVGVPPVTATDAADHLACYWSVPMDSLGVLCDPVDVAGLAAVGLRRQAEEQELPAAASAS